MRESRTKQTDAPPASRRSALKTLGGLMGLGVLGRAVASVPDGFAHTIDTNDPLLKPTPLGLQLYTLRAEMEKNVESTLARVAQTGYGEVEFAGYFGKSPAEIGALLKANKLTAPSAHVDLNSIRTKWAATLDAASAIGHQYLVCAWIGPDERKSIDNYRRIAGEFNTAAAAAKEHGIQFAYHNHDFEFIPLGDTIGYDTLLSEADAQLVKLELDLYWITKAGRDPLTYFSRYAGRFPLVHVKDMAPDGKMADVGSGKIPFKSIFAKARQGGIKHYFVERDDAPDPFLSIANSARGLRALIPR